MGQNTKYSNKEALNKNIHYYDLKDDLIFIDRESSGNKFIEYKDIETIRVVYKPGRFKTFNYECKIKYRGFSHSIHSVHYMGIANFADKSDEFFPFIKELIAKTQKINPNVKVLMGYNPFKYLIYLVIVLAVLLLLSATMLFFPVLGIFTFILHMVMVVYLLYYSFRIFRRNIPRTLSSPGDLQYIMP